MRLIHCACATTVSIPGAEHHDLSEVPSRKELRFLDAAAKDVLPEDPTPSLAEIQASPNVAHMGAPGRAPQQPSERLRIIVSGSDKALAAVLTRMMRGDYLWAEVAYVPVDPHSPAAVGWGLSGLTTDEACALACEGPVTPSPCVRTDTGDVVAGAASIYRGEGDEEYVGEIVVDSQRLVYRSGEDASARFHGQFGARLVPTPGAPGIASTPIVTPLVSHGPISKRSPEQLERMTRNPLLRRFTQRAGVAPGQTDGSRVLTGRALQSGGEAITVELDGVRRPRTVERVTFYRHLRDIQSVKMTPHEYM